MKNLYIIDAYNLIYRMFYAIPEMHTRDGQIVNAVFWVAKFIKSLTEMSPDDTIIIASESGSNFREAIFSEYKWTRDRMPDNLRSQIDAIMEFFQIAGLPILVREGYEADDVIGSLCMRNIGNHDALGQNPQSRTSTAPLQKEPTEIIIISSDKDLCQFVVDGKVRIFDAMKQKNLRRADVIEKFGVPPEQVRDYLSIVWDSSDNIPGIAGFGPKKALDLLTKYDTLEGIYIEIWVMSYELWVQVQIDQEVYDQCELTEKTKWVLIDQIANAYLSQKLASIVTDLEISPEEILSPLLSSIFQSADVIGFLKRYEFKSLIPTEYREVKKELTKVASITIDSLDALGSLTGLYVREKRIYLATEKDGSIAISIGEGVYIIDPRIVDVGDWFTVLLNREDIEIVWYDLKEDLKRILVYKNPLVWGEGQGRLF